MGKGLNQLALVEHLERYTIFNNPEGVKLCLQYLTRSLKDNENHQDDLKAFFYAAEYGHAKALKILIDHGVGIDNTYDDRTALQQAAKYGKLEAVKFLISKGASQNRHDEESCTPLGYAIRNNHFEIVEYLVKNGAYTITNDIDEVLDSLNKKANNYAENLKKANHVIDSLEYKEANSGKIYKKHQWISYKNDLEQKLGNIQIINEIVYITKLVDNIFLKNHNYLVCSHDFDDLSRLNDKGKELFVEIFENRCFASNSNNDANLIHYNEYGFIKFDTFMHLKKFFSASQFQGLSKAVNHLEASQISMVQNYTEEFNTDIVGDNKFDNIQDENADNLL